MKMYCHYAKFVVITSRGRKAKNKVCTLCFGGNKIRAGGGGGVVNVFLFCPLIKKNDPDLRKKKKSISLLHGNTSNRGEGLNS